MLGSISSFLTKNIIFALHLYFFIELFRERCIKFAISIPVLIISEVVCAKV